MLTKHSNLHRMRIHMGFGLTPALKWRRERVTVFVFCWNKFKIKAAVVSDGCIVH